MDKIQIGWVYKDKRGVDVLITREIVNKERAPETGYFSDEVGFSFEGINMGKERAITKFYSAKGFYCVSDDDHWERDLLLETGKLWVPFEVTRSEIAVTAAE